MFFDTTASNTGHISSACIKIQESLQRHLLWSGCRHHIGEIILSQVFTDLKVETTRSPDIALFLRYRKHFEILPHKSITEPLAGINLDNSEVSCRDFLEKQKLKVLELISVKQEFQRGDYREFMELCRIFLTFGQHLITFKRPGALHKARWMGKLLYSIKICLLEKHRNPSTWHCCQQCSASFKDQILY